MIGFIFSLALAAAPAQGSNNFQVPRKFWGEYHVSLSQCGKASDDSRLVISGNRVQFYETKSQLKSMLDLPNDGLVVMLNMSGEGETWSEMTELTLAQNGKALVTRTSRSADTPASTDMTRLRCPGR